MQKKEQVKKSPTTPEALKNLPKEKIDEYKKLKEEIKRREKSKGTDPSPAGITKSTSPPVISSTAKDQAEKGATKKGLAKRVERIAKTGMKIQIGAGPRTVQSGDKIKKFAKTEKSTPDMARDTSTKTTSENKDSLENKDPSDIKDNTENRDSKDENADTVAATAHTEGDVRGMEGRLAGER